MTQPNPVSNYFRIGKEFVFFNDDDATDTARAFEIAKMHERPHTHIWVWRVPRSMPWVGQRVIGT